jgi:hypothetical protein
MKRASSDYSEHLIALCFFSLMVIIPLIFTGCTTGETADHGEYEVIAVSSYEVVVGSNEDGPVTETNIAFIYRSAQFRKNYKEESIGSSDNFIIIGDANKYIVVRKYRETDEYLYLTQETYDSIFSEVSVDE